MASLFHFRKIFYILCSNLYFSLSIIAQECDLRLGGGNSDHWDAFVDRRNDGVTIIKFHLLSSRVKAVQGRYRFTNYLGETNWETLDVENIYWPPFDFNPPGLETVQSVIPWYDRRYDYRIQISTRARCADGSWTPWRDDDYTWGLQAGYPLFCGSDYWLESKSVGARKVTFNYRYGTETYEVQLSSDGGQTWPISGVSTNWENSITISGLESNTRYHHRHRVQCSNRWSYWATYNADGEEIGPFTTDCVAPALNEISTSNANSGTAIEVSCLVNADKYQFRLRSQGSSTWTTSTEKIPNEHTFNNLQKFVVYEIQCRLTCDDGHQTDWSSSKEHVIPGTCPVPLVGDIGARDIGTKTATLFCRSGHGDGIIERHLFRYRENSGSTWTERRSTSHEININNLKDGTQYVMQVQHECTGGTTGNWSNMVFFTTDQNCKIDVDKISIRNIGHDRAELRCQADREGYLWKYRRAGGGGLTELPQQTSDRITITGLTPGTVYEVALKVFCDPSFSEGYTEWVSFTTLQCLKPDYNFLVALDVTNHSAILWNPSSNSYQEDYTWQYRKSGNQNWQSVQGTGHETAIDGLMPNTTYEFRLRQVCDEGVNSDWSEIAFFVTPCDSEIRRFSNITRTSIKVFATSGGAQMYQFRYRARGASSWTYSAQLSIPEFTVSNLMPGTEYEFQVAGTCIGNGNSLWSASSFAATRPPGLDSDAPGRFQNLDIRSVECEAPWVNEITATSQNPVSAELACSRGDTETFQFRYAPAKDTNWVLTTEVNTGALTVTGLSPRTRYLFQVRLKCGDEYSDWSDTADFVTPRIVQFLNNRCYEPNLLRLSPSDVHVGSATLNCRAVAELFQFRYRKRESNQWLTLPESTGSSMQLTDLQENTVYEFQCRLFCNGGWGSFSESWLFSTLSSVGCDAPLKPGFFAIGIQRTSAKLISLHKALFYQFRYKALGASYWTYTDTVSSPEAEIEGLEPGQKYLYQVRLQCTNQASGEFSVAKLFTTRPPCLGASANNLEADSIQNQSARLRCALLTPYYVFRYRLSGTTDWQYTSILGTNEVIIRDLTTQSKYEYQVSLACAEGDFTSWSPSAFFNTALSTASRHLETMHIRLYPNPASQYLNLEGVEKMRPTNYLITDIAGRLMFSGTFRQTEFRIPISMLAEGLYFLILGPQDPRAAVLKFMVSR